MKPEINKVKDSEAKIKWLVKESKMLRIKSITLRNFGGHR